jgi:hypothetical protein
MIAKSPSDMNQELQRIKIAEACGWTKISQRCMWGLPDYLNDLNAMAKAEKSIGDKNLYRKFLYLVVLDDPENIANEPAWATAAQRAEAFLRTLNLWEE